MNDVYVHPSALVESDRVGAGTRVWAFAHIMRGVIVGEDCNIGDGVFIESGARLGRGVTVKNGVMIWSGVTLEDYVFVGPGVVFTNDRYPRSPRLPDVRDRYADPSRWLVPTVVETGVALGANATVLCGIRLGEFCTVSAGSVVTRDVLPYQLVAGNPARPRGYVDREGRPLRAQEGGVWLEPRSGRRYRIEEGRPNECK